MTYVLIIDSDADASALLASKLNGRGVESRVTADGTEGLEVAKGTRPDVVVLCVELARVSGYSVCNKLKKDASLATIPLILTSSQATEETFEQHKKLKTRADQYLRKPYDLSQILGLIAQYTDVEDSEEDHGESAGSVEDDIDHLEVSLDEMEVEGEAAAKAAAPSADDDLEDLLNLGPTPGPDTEILSIADDVAAKAPAASPPTGRRPGGEGELELMRTENQKLRQKVQSLEQTLQEKELSFNDRLLAESGKARDAVELRTKIGNLERELTKAQAALQKTEESRSGAETSASAAREDLEIAQADKDALSEKLAQLVAKVKELASERDALRAELDSAKDATRTSSEAVAEASDLKAKALRALDVAMQLVDEAASIH